jgi:hypothetical protein
MVTDRWVRASDQDPRSDAELLSEACAMGRLSHGCPRITRTGPHRTRLRNAGRSRSCCRPGRR